MIQIIPAIDLLDGQVVRLTKGDYNEKTVYPHSPLEQARLFLEAGFKHIHVVDLNGAKSGRFENLDVIRSMVNQLGVSVQTGGGVRTIQQIEQLLEAEISGVICSSMTIRKPKEWLEAIRRWPDRMILGMDLKNGEVSWGGWLESEAVDLNAYLKPMTDAGLTRILSTDISRDGTLQGPNWELYRSLQEQFPSLDWIASGGVSSLDDLTELNRLELYGVVVGKAYYEGRITLEELASFGSEAASEQTS